MVVTQPRRPVGRTVVENRMVSCPSGSRYLLLIAWSKRKKGESGMMGSTSSKSHCMCCASHAPPLSALSAATALARASLSADSTGVAPPATAFADSTARRTASAAASASSPHACAPARCLLRAIRAIRGPSVT